VVIESKEQKKRKLRSRFAEVVDALKALDPSLTDVDVAVSVGSSGSAFSRYRSGERGVNPHLLTRLEAELAAWEAEMRGPAQAAGGVCLPYAGRVCAGSPVDVLDVQMGEKIVPPGLVPKGRAVVVTVAGASMAPVLHSGDVIVVGLDLEPRAGDLVCVTLPQSGTVVRRLVVVEGEQRLAAEADGFSPLTAAGPQVHVHGVVVGIAERRLRDD
jgi:SOS-response transcriptional repressor LexA